MLREAETEDMKSAAAAEVGEGKTVTLMKEDTTEMTDPEDAVTVMVTEAGVTVTEADITITEADIAVTEADTAA